MAARTPGGLFLRLWFPLLGSNQAARDQSPMPYQLGEGGEAGALDTIRRCNLKVRNLARYPVAPRELGVGARNRTLIFGFGDRRSAIELRLLTGLRGRI